MGLITLTDLEEQASRGVKNPQKGKGRYVGHKTVHNKLVGDWAIPTGWTYDDVDNNAHWVIRMSPEQINKAKADHTMATNATAYEMGLVWDEEDMCYYPVYDFADSGGRALSSIVGKVEYGGQRDKLTSAYSKLMQNYQTLYVQYTAEAQGQECEFQMDENGDVVAYAYFNDDQVAEAAKETY